MRVVVMAGLLLAGCAFHVPASERDLAGASDDLASGGGGGGGACSDAWCGKGLVASYSFDEGSGTIAHDSSGNGNDGTITGARWTQGKVGGALAFDGTAAFVAVASSPSLELSAGLTVSAWATNGPLGNWAPLVMKTSTASWHDGYGLFYDHPDRFFCGYETDYKNGATCLAAFDGAPTSTFNHFVVTYDGASVTLYVNGSLAGAPAAVSGAIVPGSAPLFIGKDIGGYFWNGRIDEVRIFGRALSAAEVKQLHDSP